jgi:hypothetical protein
MLFEEGQHTEHAGSIDDASRRAFIAKNVHDLITLSARVIAAARFLRAKAGAARYLFWVGNAAVDNGFIGGQCGGDFRLFVGSFYGWCFFGPAIVPGKASFALSACRRLPPERQSARGRGRKSLQRAAGCIVIGENTGFTVVQLEGQRMGFSAECEYTRRISFQHRRMMLTDQESEKRNKCRWEMGKFSLKASCGMSGIGLSDKGVEAKLW